MAVYCLCYGKYRRPRLLYERTSPLTYITKLDILRQISRIFIMYRRIVVDLSLLHLCDKRSA